MSRPLLSVTAALATLLLVAVAWHVNHATMNRCLPTDSIYIPVPTKSEEATDYSAPDEQLKRCLLGNPPSKLACFNLFNRRVAEGLYKQILAETSMPESPWNQVEAHQDNWGSMDFVQTTHHCDPLHLVRLGDKDGGKWICEPIDQRQGCVLYSVGSRGDFSFELAFKEFTRNECEIHTFDCTIPDMTAPPGITLHHWCLGDDEKVEGRQHHTLATMMRELKHDSVRYLKLDCEGCEWVALERIFAQADSLPKQLWFELHAWEGHMNKAFGRQTWTHAHVKLALLASQANYGVAMVEHNPGCAACAEFLLVHEAIAN